MTKKERKVFVEMSASHCAAFHFEMFKNTLLARSLAGEHIGPVDSIEQAFYAGFREGRKFRMPSAPRSLK